MGTPGIGKSGISLVLRIDLTFLPVSSAKIGGTMESESPIS